MFFSMFFSPALLLRDIKGGSTDDKHKDWLV
jgi:hypothetical protein